MKSLGNFPDPFIAEISGQPDALRRAATGIADQAPALDAAAARARGATIVFTGMGSSYDACYPAVTELARAGIGSIHVDASELLHFRAGMLGPATVLVAVSQSGESAEVVRLVREVRASPRPGAVVAVTNGTDSTLSALADIAFDTHAGHETGPSTMTFAGALAVIHALALAMAGTPASAILAALHREAGLTAVALERLLGESALADDIVAWFASHEMLVILGRGSARAAAEMGALTIKEAVGMPVESLQTAQFRHGPLELAGPELAAIVIATEPETRELDLGVASELVAAGAAVLTVTLRPEPTQGTMNVAVGPLDRALAPAVSILPAQLLAWRLSSLRGREPGAYYRASKVTTRE